MNSGNPNPTLYMSVQLHATSSGNFVGLNYDYARHPCLAGTEVALPGDLNFPESSSVPVWLPVAASITQKAQPAPAAGTKPGLSRSAWSIETTQTPLIILAEEVEDVSEDWQDLTSFWHREEKQTASACLLLQVGVRVWVFYFRIWKPALVADVRRRLIMSCKGKACCTTVA